jgi:hypothetical protein
MKKIIIMLMSCNQEHFLKQEQDCIDTYLSRLPDNFDYIIYRSNNTNTFEFDSDKHLLLVPEKDDLFNTFNKTYSAFYWLVNNMQYDYILRTNTSTYINVELLNAFVQSLDNDTELWGSELFYDCVKQNVKGMYLRGNCLLLSKRHIDTILNDGMLCVLMSNRLIDDETIGAIFLLHPEYTIKSYTECWYKSLNKQYSYHQISMMNNTDKSFNLLKKCVAIQIRNYEDRSLEHQYYFEIDEVFKNNKYTDISDCVNFLYDYSTHPDIFCGEKFGYAQTKYINNNYVIKNGTT